MSFVVVELDPRDLAVFQGIADGLPLSESAEKAGLTYNYAKKRLADAYPLMGADSLPHAIALLFRRGLIT